MRRFLPVLAAVLAGAPIGPAGAASAPPPVAPQASVVPVEIDKEAKIWYKRGNPRYDRDHGTIYPDRYYSNGSKSRSPVAVCVRNLPFDLWYGAYFDRRDERRRCRF